jgi:hypothetical protein
MRQVRLRSDQTHWFQAEASERRPFYLRNLGHFCAFAIEEAPSRPFDQWSAIYFMPAIRVAPGAKHIVGSNPTLSAI